MQITTSQVKERLLSNLEGVLDRLFPNGTREGNEFRVGSVSGERGKKGKGGSLSVQLRGPNRGVWRDHAFGNDPAQKGDIVSLWCAANNQTLKEAFPEMKRFAGFNHAEPIAKKNKPFAPKKDISVLTQPVHQYLSGRGLSDQTLVRYKVRSHKRYSKHGNSEFILFPYIDTEGDAVMIKSIGLERVHGVKDIWTSDPHWTLWGWWMVGDDDREIIICEGEIDAMSLYQISPGIPVLSLPNGTSGMDWIDNDWDRLQLFEKIWVVTDEDPPGKDGLKPGEEAAKAISRRLGPARVRRVPMPNKLNDVNAVLLDGDETIFNWKEAWEKHAYAFDPPTIAAAEEFRADTHAALERQKKFREENKFIWASVPFQFRNGEMTVISGYPEGGKSAWIYQTHAHEITIGEKWFMVSLEIPPEKMVIQIAHCLFGRFPTHEDIDATYDWLVGKLYFLRVLGEKKATLPEMMMDLDYACQRFGCTRFVVDSLHFLVGKEDYIAQDEVSLVLSTFAKNHDVHVGLVCHSKIKDLGEDKIPGQGQVEGSGGITKPIDNGITIWRNIGKDASIDKAKESGDEKKLEKAEAASDAVMYIWKNKETGKHPYVRLWFDEAGKSFRTKRDGDVWGPFRDKIPTDEQSDIAF